MREWISNHKNLLSIIGGVLLTMIIGWTDYITGPELIFSAFYLFPIMIVAWFNSVKFTGYIFSAIAAATLFVTNEFLTPDERFGYLIPFWSMFVNLAFFITIVLLINRIKANLEKEKQLATTDPLTGILNTRHYYMILENEIKRHMRYGNPFTLLFIDVDNFKNVNDSFGHSEGDRLLREITGAISKSMRSTDRLARLGGDEFSILLPEEDFESAGIIIRKLQNMLLSTFAGKGAGVTFSIGAITVVRASTCTADSIIKKADELMYAVKKSGKNGLQHEILAQEASEEREHGGS